MAGAATMAGAWFIHWPVWTVRLVRGLYGPFVKFLVSRSDSVVT